MTKTIEYRVRPVTRYIVTRFESSNEGGSCSGGSESLGEFDHEPTAYRVGYALAKAEHEKLGYPTDDARIKYPDEPVIQKQVVSGPIGIGGLSGS
jgi:hypothetical protein